MITGKVPSVPAHKSIFTAIGEGRKGGTEDEMRDWNTEGKEKKASNGISPSSPLFFQVLLKASE